ERRCTRRQSAGSSGDVLLIEVVAQQSDVGGIDAFDEVEDRGRPVTAVDQGRLHRRRGVLFAADDRGMQDRPTAALAPDESLALEVGPHGGDGGVGGIGLRAFDDLPARERHVVPQQAHHLLLEGAEADRRGVRTPAWGGSHERTLLSDEGTGHAYWPLSRMITATTSRTIDSAARMGCSGAK